MAILIPTDPEAFFTTFIPQEFTRNTAGKALPHMPYSLVVELEGASRYYYKVNDGKLDMQSGAGAPAGDIQVTMTAKDFKELIRAARSNAPDSPPPPPAVPPTYQFPALDTIAGSFSVIIDDLGDKRTVHVRFGPADGAKPKTTIHTTVDFIVSQNGKSIAVDQLLKSGGLRIDGDMGYLLRIANAFTGKTRRRER